MRQLGRINTSAQSYASFNEHRIQLRIGKLHINQFLKPQYSVSEYVHLAAYNTLETQVVFVHNRSTLPVTAFHDLLDGETLQGTSCSNS
jgi:uncharacterized protein YueI